MKSSPGKPRRAGKGRAIPWAAMAVKTHHAYAGLEVTIPIQVVSTLNRREHWAKLLRRKNEQWQGLAIAFTTLSRPELPVKVTLTRLYRKQDKPMDQHDNLRAAFKGCADWLTTWLKLESDADRRVSWAYHQELGDVVGVVVKIERHFGAWVSPTTVMPPGANFAWAPKNGLA